MATPRACHLHQNTDGNSCSTEVPKMYNYLNNLQVCGFMGVHEPYTTFSHNYQDLVKNLAHQFMESSHKRMSTTRLLKICQGPSEYQRDFLTHFNESTIKVVNPNQEIFVYAFQTGLRVRHVNDSLAYRPSLSLVDVVICAKCCIKGDETPLRKSLEL